jgi:uncharacterized protein DUF3300
MTGRQLLSTCLAATLVVGFGAPVGAQSTYNPPKPGGGSAAATTTRAAAGTQPSAQFKPEEIEQIVAPIALYPDSLLAQVLMASTYPLEVVQADRAVKANPKLKDSPDELNKLTYDPSVKSLINFPQVLTMMSEKLDWTVKLGDAFIADQKSVMDAVQRLRNKAYAQGNLKSSNEQKVTVEAASTTAPAAANAPLVSTQQQPQVIVIESTTPNVVYVPTYSPTVVYGAWPYPAYPPAYYYPPGYVAGAAMISFGVGMAMGAAWGHAWGGCNWHGGDVDIDVNRNVNYNNNINRTKYQNEINNRARNTSAGGQGQGNRFQHDTSHRQGVAYRDSATNDRYRGSGNERTTAQSRDAYRGRADAGRQDIARGGAADFQGGGNLDRSGSNAFGNARTGSTGNRATTADRSATGQRSSGFGGVDSGRSGATAASNRGQTSRSGGYSSGGNRSYGGSSGGARSAPRSAPRGGGGRR